MQTSWVKIAECVWETRGGTTHTHHSQAETRQTRQSDPYSTSPERRAAPSPPKRPTSTASYRTNPSGSRRVSSFRNRKSLGPWWLSGWKLGSLHWLCRYYVVTSPPTSSSSCEQQQNASHSSAQIKGAAGVKGCQGLTPSDTVLHVRRLEENNGQIHNENIIGVRQTFGWNVFK